MSGLKRQEIISKIAYVSFYLAVIIEVLIVLVDKSALTNPIEGRLFQLTFLLFFVKVCLTKYSWKEYLAIALLLGLGAVSYFATQRNEMVRVVMFLAACKNIDMRKCLKMVFYLTLVGCTTIILLSIFGVVGTVALTQEYGRGGVETRYTLGMGHPNALQCMVWALTVLSLYLYGEKLRWYGYLFILGVNCFFFFLTDSKTSLIAALFTIILAYCVRIVKKEKLLKAGMFCCCIGVVSCVGLSVWIASSAYRVYNYVWHGTRDLQTDLLLMMDRALTGRIRTLTENVRWEGTTATWSLFSAPWNNYYFDMGWIRLFYWYGIIPGLVIVLLLIVWMIYCYKKKYYMALVLIASFSLYSVFEAHAISVYLARNYLLFVFGAMWADMLTWDNRREKT